MNTAHGAPFSLAGKVAWITGSSTGLGKAIFPVTKVYQHRAQTDAPEHADRIK